MGPCFEGALYAAVMGVCHSKSMKIPNEGAILGDRTCWGRISTVEGHQTHFSK